MMTPEPADDLKHRQPRHLESLLQELNTQYEQLTARIGALDTDIGRELDSEKRFVLKQRRQELYDERAHLHTQMTAVEHQLAEALGKGTPKSAITTQSTPEYDELLIQLPAPDYGSRLFGVDKQVEQLIRSIDRLFPWIIAIQGIGGVGKTALVNYTLRKMDRSSISFERVVWVSAKQQLLTGSGIIGSRARIDLDQVFDSIGNAIGLKDVARLSRQQKVLSLAKYFRSMPCVVVIDNIEAVDDYAEMVSHLEHMADPSKFVLTSRETVPALSGISNISLDELEEGPSTELVKDLVDELIGQGKHVSSFDPRGVYAIVGGNPLAIRLVVSQMQYYPPEVVFAGMREGDMESIYRYIYRKSWSLLSEDSRSILFAIRRANDEVDFEWLEVTMELPRRRLMAGLDQLRSLSLIRPLNAVNRFAIHRFTSTFLSIEFLHQWT